MIIILMNFVKITKNIYQFIKNTYFNSLKVNYQFIYITLSNSISNI